jgi:hypothetical protein
MIYKKYFALYSENKVKCKVDSLSHVQHYELKSS